MKTFLIGAIFLATSASARAETINPAPLTDGEIAKVLITLDDGEIEAARMAQTKSHNDDVKNYASMMSTQHRENALASHKLVTKDKLDARESELSKSLRSDAKAETKKLEKSGSAFDKNYIASQVKMHEQALRTIDEMLLPNAKNGDLHSHLEKTRVAVSEHLQHAKALQEKIH